MAGLAVKTLRPVREGRAVDLGSKENDQIMTAAEKGDIDTLVSMSHSGIDVTTARDVQWGDTVLHAACGYGQNSAVAVIITSKISVDVRNNYQLTPMHYAAANGKVEIIKILKDNRAAVDAKDISGRTPLHWAAYDSSAVETLVNLGATVDIKNNRGYTPLADAVENGRRDVVKLLVDKHKADTSKVPQRLQQKMKELVREEAKVAADSKDTSTNDSQQVPTMKELLVKVIPKVAADWKQLAFMLEFDIPRVNIIKQKGRDDPESCCCELLCEWLDSDHGIKPKNWTTLLTALKQIKKLTSVTDEIEKDLTAQSQLTISQNEPDSNTTSSAHTSKELSQAPLMHQVVKVVVPRIAGHWKAVAYNLHYDVTRVRIIQEQCRDDPEQCSYELFMYWLQSSEGLGPRSWETLLSALKQASNLKSVSESIEKELMELLKSND